MTCSPLTSTTSATHEPPAWITNPGAPLSSWATTNVSSVEPGREVAEEPGHPVHTDHRTHRGVDEAAAVARQHDVRRQGGDEGLDVAAEPGGEEALGDERGVGPSAGVRRFGTVTW